MDDPFLLQPVSLRKKKQKNKTDGDFEGGSRVSNSSDSAVEQGHGFIRRRSRHEVLPVDSPHTLYPTHTLSLPPPFNPSSVGAGTGMSLEAQPIKHGHVRASPLPSPPRSKVGRL